MNIGIITGASSGMGKWFAFYAPFYFPEIDELWITGRNVKRLEQVSRKTKIPTKVIPADLTTAEGMEVLASNLSKENVRIKLLVQSAGLGKIGAVADVPAEELEEMIDLNCKSLTKVAKLCIPFMAEESHIINLASAAAFVPQPEFAVYAATKSYALSFSEALYKELHKDKIYVTAVCPGCVDTPFFDVAQKYQEMKSYKSFFMSKDKAVVKTALVDAKKKKRISIHGTYMKLFYYVCKYLPTGLLLKFM